jgi:hypothetical protein
VLLDGSATVEVLTHLASELRKCDHFSRVDGAWARQVHIDLADNTARPGRHDQNAVSKIDGLGNAMSDEQDGLATLHPDALQFGVHLLARKRGRSWTTIAICLTADAVLSRMQFSGRPNAAVA